MNEDAPQAAARPKTPIEHATDAVGLVLTLVALYRFSYPEGPEPAEIVRDVWARITSWATARERRRRQLDRDLEAIRNLPETEVREP